MIKIDNISVIVDGSEYSAKVEIPSQITTSTPQEETVDLAKTPNLFIKLVDPGNTLKIGVNVEAQLITEEGTYTMICDVISKNQMYTTLQYAYGMTFEADDSSDDDSSDDPEIGPGFEYVGQQIDTSFTATWKSEASGYSVNSFDGDVDVSSLINFKNVNQFNFLYNGDIFMSSTSNSTIHVDIMTWYNGNDEIIFDPVDAGFYFGPGESFSALSETGEAETRTADVYAVVKSSNSYINIDDISLMRNDETGKYEYNGHEYDSIDEFINTIPEELRQYFSNYTPQYNEGEETPYDYYIACSAYHDQILAYWNNMSAKIGTATMEISAYVDKPTADPVLSQSINNILGSNYDVVNDMSEEDALAAANNILYGDEEQPR